MNTTVDLFLGGDIGRWALLHTPPDMVRVVVTGDQRTVSVCSRLEIPCVLLKAFTPQSDIGVSVHFPQLFKSSSISSYKKLYNLHPGYLPDMKGMYPCFWALWENKPAGATLHEIAARVDSGPIVDRTLVQYSDSDTGGTLLAKVREAERALYLKYIDKILKRDEIEAFPQHGEGTIYYKKDFFKLKEESDVSAMDPAILLKLIRCLTCPGWSGLKVTFGGTSFHLRLEDISRVYELSKY